MKEIINKLYQIFLFGCIFLCFSCGEESLPPINAEFGADNVLILEGEPVSFTDASSGEPDKWTWEFEGGNPITSNNQNPIITYETSGTYSVSLTSSNKDNSDEITKSDFIVVIKEVTTLFSVNDSTIDEGEQVIFEDLSISATSWEWQFDGGNPESSNEQNPTIIYNQSGIFEVTLTTSNQASSNSLRKTEYIFVRPTEGLVAHYPFNGNADDESGNNLNGTVVEATLTQDRNDNISAYYFDGINDRIVVDNNTLFENQQFTISAWFIAEKDTGTVISLSVPPSGSNNSGYNVAIIDGFPRGTSNISSGMWAVALSDTPTSLNEWHHIVFTYDGVTLVLYLDNEAIVDLEQPHLVNYNEHNPINIGTYATKGGGTWFTGKLDDIRIYNRALSVTENYTLFVE